MKRLQRINSRNTDKVYCGERSLVAFVLIACLVSQRLSAPNLGNSNETEKCSASMAPVQTADLILLTHNRRDIVEAARSATGPSTRVFAPEASRELLEGAEAHWQNWWLKRFDYYGQQVTKIPTRNFAAHRYLVRRRYL